MPPKKKTKTKNKDPRQIFQVSPSPIKLKEKKTLPSQEETQDQYLTFLAQYFEQKEKKENHEKKPEENEFEGQKETTTVSFDDVKEWQVDTHCLICDASDFQKGKYILGCRHLLCNDCFQYWSAIETKCPACFKDSPSVLMILSGSSRVTKIKPKYYQQECQKCLGRNNEEQMYYCDRCQKRCIHVYCHPLLLNYEEGQEWFCQECQGKEKQNKSKRKQPAFKKKKGVYASELDNLELQKSKQSRYDLRRRSSDVIPPPKQQQNNSNKPPSKIRNLRLNSKK